MVDGPQMEKRVDVSLSQEKMKLIWGGGEDYYGDRR